MTKELKFNFAVLEGTVKASSLENGPYWKYPSGIAKGNTKIDIELPIDKVRFDVSERIVYVTINGVEVEARMKSWNYELN